MAVVGQACLLIALAVTVYGIGASLYGARTGARAWIDSGRRAVYALAALTTVAYVVLEIAFLRLDFSFALVTSHSSTTTPVAYRLAAAWSSQAGSLLLWLLLLSLFSSLVLFTTRRKLRDVAPYATAVLLGFGAFFVGVMLFGANPFATLANPAAEGAGLNPLLRNPGMMMHPPMLYAGYTLFAIPFAFAVGALIVRRVDAEWITATRRFALAAWFFLGLGILLGARWSYAELGWGGYWAWDPVENASLMPWLTGTALLHSVMIQQKRGMLKVWNISLVLTTGVLSVLGTFLVRSGILDSIHAFGASTVGIPFLILIGVMIAGSIGLVMTRMEMLRSEHRLDSLLSREAIFMGNNIVLVSLCVVIFWGTFYPLISEAITGQKRAIGPPWFDQFAVPLTLALVLLSGIGPIIAWRRATAANARRNFTVPIVFAAVALAVLVPFGVGDRPWALGMFVIAAFVLGTIGQEFWRGAQARRAMSGEGLLVALVTLVQRNRRRYGGYIIHLGMAALFVGVAASSAFQNARDVRLMPGQMADVAGHQIRYEAPLARIDTRGGSLERIVFGARLSVWRDGRKVATLAPERGYYPSRDVAGLGAIGRFFEGEATSEVGMDAGLRRDVWTAVSPDISKLKLIINEGDRVFAESGSQLAPDEEARALGLAVRGLVDRYRTTPPPATFRLIVSPMVTWIWLGALLVFAGGLLILLPGGGVRQRQTSAARYAARLAREIGPRPSRA